MPAKRLGILDASPTTLFIIWTRMKEPSTQFTLFLPKGNACGGFWIKDPWNLFWKKTLNQAGFVALDPPASSKTSIRRGGRLGLGYGFALGLDAQLLERPEFRYNSDK